MNSENQEKTCQFLTAMGDPTRLQIIWVLAAHDRLNVTDIAGHFRVSRPTISHHLKILKDADVVGREQVGQEVYYWVNRDKACGVLRQVANKLEDEKPATV